MPTPAPIPVSEAARLLGVHARTVHRLVTRGALRSVAKAPGLRGAYFLDRTEVAALATKRAAGGAS